MYYTQRNYVEAVFERNHGNLDQSMAAWETMAINKSKMFFTDHGTLSGVVWCLAASLACAMMLATGTHGRMARFWLLAFWCPAASLVCAVLLATTHGSCEHLLQGSSSLKLKDAVSIFCCWCT
jgi:hypothetical protein